jgi:hypothetical protein
MAFFILITLAAVAAAALLMQQFWSRELDGDAPRNDEPLLLGDDHDTLRAA